MKLALAFYLSFISLAIAQEMTPTDFLHESRAQYEARMKWWCDARFGICDGFLDGLHCRGLLGLEPGRDPAGVVSGGVPRASVAVRISSLILP